MCMYTGLMWANNKLSKPSGPGSFASFSAHAPVKMRVNLD